MFTSECAGQLRQTAGAVSIIRSGAKKMSDCGDGEREGGRHSMAPAGAISPSDSGIWGSPDRAQAPSASTCLAEFDEVDGASQGFEVP